MLLRYWYNLIQIIVQIRLNTCKRVANFLRLVFTAKRKGLRTKRMLENQRDRGKKKQGTRSCCLTKWYAKMLSEITTSYRKVIGMVQYSHHEESCHLTKWCGILEPIVGAKTLYMLFVRAQIPKNRSISQRFSKSHHFMLPRSRVRHLPPNLNGYMVHVYGFSFFSFFRHTSPLKRIKTPSQHQQIASGARGAASLQ